MPNKNSSRTSAEIAYQFDLFRNGDGYAFKFFYDLYHRPLYLYILDLLHRDTITEEVADDAFVLLWDRRSSINDSVHLVNFLYLVARRQAMAHQVNLKKQVELEAAWARYQYGWATQRDEVEIARDKILLLILQHIDKLPSRQKEVFLLSFSQRMDVRSIARLLGTGEKNVYKHLSKAYQYFTKSFRMTM